MIYKLNLQQFAEEGAAAAPETGAAETATAAEGTGAAESIPVSAGDALPDGTQVPNARVAAALEKQMRRHPELRQVYGQNQGAPAGTPAGGEEQPPAEKSIDERWEELKKGEFADLYGRDVQNAIQNRFKNAANQQAQLDRLEPMLKVLRERAGVQSNDDLIKQVMDDDSLYEEAANKAGMTISAYKVFMEQQQLLQQAQAREQESIRTQKLHAHYNMLQQQAEQLKQLYPDFDLRTELRNPKFLQMTSPEGGVSVEDAYFAIHHRELAPQMMAYGMQRAKAQMGQTIQAQRSRPAEGAMKGKSQAPAAQMKVDPSKMKREERQEIKRQVRMGKKVSFD